MSTAPHNTPPKSTTISNLDWLGLGLSSLCAVHCLALSLLASLIPILEILDQGGRFHWAIAILIVPIGVFAFWRGYRKHLKKNVLFTGFLGLCFVLLGLWMTLPDHSMNHELKPGMLLTLTGSLLLIFSHYRNWQFSRCS